jgi:hypothetical protein
VRIIRYAKKAVAAVDDKRTASQGLSRRTPGAARLFPIDRQPRGVRSAGARIFSEQPARDDQLHDLLGAVADLPSDDVRSTRD